MRDKLADQQLDLRVASELEVAQVIANVSGTYVDEDAAMQHVKDILMQDTGMIEEDFDTRVSDDVDLSGLLMGDDDSVDVLLESINSEQSGLDDLAHSDDSEEDLSEDSYDNDMEQDLAQINLSELNTPEMNEPEIFV